MSLKAKLISLVELSKSNENAVGYLQEVLRETTEWRDRQQVQLAIRHAERLSAIR